VANVVRVPAVRDMDDPTLIKHMEARHEEDVSTTHLGAGEPDRVAQGLPPRLRAGVEWRTFHNKMHELYDGREHNGRPWFDHVHKEPVDG